MHSCCWVFFYYYYLIISPVLNLNFVPPWDFSFLCLAWAFSVTARWRFWAGDWDYFPFSKLRSHAIIYVRTVNWYIYIYIYCRIILLPLSIQEMNRFRYSTTHVSEQPKWVTLRCPFNTWHHIISRVVCQSISFHVRLKRRPANCLLTSHYITFTITNHHYQYNYKIWKMNSV